MYMCVTCVFVLSSPHRAHLQGFKGKKYRLSEPYIGFNKHKKSTEDKAYIVNGNKGVVVSHRRRQLCSRSTCARQQ